MECIQGDPILFCVAMAGMVWLLATGKLRPNKPARPAAPVDVRPLSADALYDAPLAALKAEEQRLHGIYLGSLCTNKACRSRIDDVARAISWQEVGGSRRQPTMTKPKPAPTPITRKSTALVPFTRRDML